MDRLCPRCKSVRVAPGKCLDAVGYWRGWGGTIFRPSGLRFLMRLFSADLRVSDPVLACVDCGLMWAELRPMKLRQTIRSMCKPEVRQQLGL